MSNQPQLAYLGPIGTHTHQAALTFAKRMDISDPDLLECSSIDEIFDAVDRGKSEYGVVPIENSLEGAVTASLDNFALKSSAIILGEEVLDIHQSLVMHPDAEIADINTIASHTQGLAQCRRYIAEYFPGRNTITTSSTAESAKLAAEDKHTAGIATTFAAELYGAKVHEEEAGDHYGNQTSFVLIARQGAPAVFSGDTYRTSLALFLQEDKAGTLLMILTELAYAGLNLTKIQSRPTKQALGQYMFFVDFVGSVNDPNVQTALNCLRLKLREVKVIGCYPIK